MPTPARLSGSLQHRFGNAEDRRPASAFPPVRSSSSDGFPQLAVTVSGAATWFAWSCALAAVRPGAS